MEDLNFNKSEDTSSEKDDEQSSSSTKKEKSAGALGAFLVEPKAEAKDETAEESIWERLTGIGDKPKAEKADVEDDSESLAELPEELTEDERHIVEQAVVYDNQAEESQSDSETVDEWPASAGNEAVQAFRERILVEDEPAEQAYQETLQEISPPDSEIEVEATLPPQEFSDQPIDLGRIPLAEQAAEQAEEESEADDPVRQPAAPIILPAKKAKTEEERAKEYPWQTYYNGAFGGREDRKARDEEGAFGGTLDYLIGRRRGRIKAEKKFAPIQKKLEKQVKDLRKDIVQKENTIRELAIKNAKQEGRIAPKAESKKLAEQPLPRRSIEATQIHGAVPPERIGHVLVNNSESPQPDVSKPQFERLLEKQQEKAPISGSIDKHVETLSRAELLELSGKIVIEGTTLRQAYETHLVSEKGLRRIVAEHLKGGDIHKVLRQEFLQREIDFERDPIMRGRAQSEAAAGGKTALNELLQQVDAKARRDQLEELAVLTARAANDSKKQNKRKRNRRALDMSFIGIIFALLAVVLMLALNRN